MATVTLYRGIALNEGETINLENIGCSWSLCEVFADSHAQEIMDAKGKDGYVVLSTTVEDSQIDWDNTLYAMQTRPNEYEVVIYGEITASLHYAQWVELEEDEFVGDCGANSFEDYNENYDGKLTKDDFFAVANEF